MAGAAGNRDGEINPRRRCGDDVCRQHVSTPASILQPPRALDHQWIVSRTRDVAGVISENGLSIRSYSGSFDGDSHTFSMSYEVSALSVRINKVGSALRDVDGVRSYNLGWHLE